MTQMDADGNGSEEIYCKDQRMDSSLSTERDPEAPLLLNFGTLRLQRKRFVFHLRSSAFICG